MISENNSISKFFDIARQEKPNCGKIRTFAVRNRKAKTTEKSRQDMRTAHIRIFLLMSLLVAVPFSVAAQRKRAPVPPKAPQFLEYEVVDGDTIYMDVLTPSQISLYRRKGKEWRKYYRLVWNFSKTYPYALVARKLVHDTDSTFEANDFSRRKKEKYVSSVQKELFGAFEQPLRHMTISQGQLLMKLIDREVGKSSYYIIKDYKNGIAAGFWQGIAKLFGSDMKKHYDPEGDDKQTEELVRKWDSGEFPALYFSIFGEYPARVEIPSKYM